MYVAESRKRSQCSAFSWTLNAKHWGRRRSFSAAALTFIAGRLGRQAVCSMNGSNRVQQIRKHRHPCLLLPGSLRMNRMRLFSAARSG